MTVRDRVKHALTRAFADDASSRPSALDEARLFETHERAARASESAMRLVQATGATAAQQKSALDAVADHARMLVARGRDLRAPVQQIKDILERAKLVARNSGLEGARIGDPAGKALVGVADELRALVGGALDALRELGEMQARTEQDRERLLQRIEQAQERARALADELLRSQAAQRESETALRELGESIGSSAAHDPETARALSQAAEHARELLAALTLLSSSNDRRSVVSALRPVLGPLLGALRELYRGRPRDERP